MSSPPTSELRTARLVLRPLAQRDLPAVVAGCSDPRVSRFIPLPVPYTAAHAREWLAAAPRRWQDGAELSRALTTHDVDLCVGVATIRLRENGSVGYWLAGSARGRGLMAEAVAALIDWAAREYDISTLILTTHPDNRASQRTAIRAGFQPAGTTVAARPYHDGETRSMLFRWTVTS